MSDEEVDSSNEAPEKDSALDPTTVVEDNESASDEASQDTPSIQEKRLADTEKALQERQREFHEISRQLAEVKGQMSVYTQQNQPVVKDVLDEDGIAAKLRDDPSAVLGILKQKLAEQQGQFASVLEARDRYYNDLIAKSDPNVVAMREKIAELKKDPDYGTFTDQQLAVIAQKSTPRKQYRGAPGGSRSGQVEKEADITESTLWKQIYPDYEAPKKK